MSDLTNIDRLFGQPNPQTIKGKLMNIGPEYYLIGGLLLVIIIAKVNSGKGKNLIKKFHATDV